MNLIPKIFLFCLGFPFYCYSSFDQHNDVLIGDGLFKSKAEAAAVTNRIKVTIGVDADLEKFPIVAALGSGGSVRAAIAFLAFLLALEKIGVLKYVQYVATVSGSSWPVVRWQLYQKSLSDVYDELRDRLSWLDIAIKPIYDDLKEKTDWKRYVSLCDAWGCALEQVFLGTKNMLCNVCGDNGPNALCVRLSDLVSAIKSGEYPYPIFTSVLGDTKPPYEWVEFTPHAIGSNYLKTWINPDDFGKKFDNGKCVGDNYHGEYLGYLLGLWGAFYAVDAYDVVNAIRQELAAKHSFYFSSWWLRWLSWFWWGSERISPPAVFNFVKNIKDVPFNDKELLSFVDPGVAINFAIPSIFDRHASLILICDASELNWSAAAHPLRDVYDYAKAHNIKLPPIDYSVVAKEPFSVLCDEKDSSVPIIVYVRNLVPFASSKLQYSNKEFDLLAQSIIDTVIKNKKSIFDILQKVWKM